MDEDCRWYATLCSYFPVSFEEYLSDQIKRLSAESAPHTYTLVLVPRRTTLCDRVLEEEGVFGEITISSYKLEFIPLEDDLVSLEWETTFKEIFLVCVIA